MNPQHHLVLRVVSKVLIPVIALFAVYVQFHGDFGPGGGFQAGVIFAAGIILYALAFGTDKALDLVSPNILRPLSAVGVLLFGGVGVANSSITACSLTIRCTASTWAFCLSNWVSGLRSPRS